MGLSIKFDYDEFVNFFDYNNSSFDDFKTDVLWAMGILMAVRNFRIDYWVEQYSNLEFYDKDEDYTYYKTSNINLLRLIAGITLFLPCVIFKDILLIILSAVLLPFVFLYNLKIVVK